MTYTFTDNSQIEEFLDDEMEAIMRDWNYVDYPEQEDGTYGWSDLEAFSLECAFGPEE